MIQLYNKESIRETFNLFSSISRLRPNVTKCEIRGLGALNGLDLAVCTIQLVDPAAIKILGIYFSYNKKLMDQKNYCKLLQISMVF